jgi:lipopolysaccharide/colanic/teichoic acid biosynthesis glycosyltransferase
MMSGKSPDLKALPAGQRNSSAGHRFPQREAEFSNTNTRNSRPSRTVKISSPSWRNNARERRIDIAPGLGTGLARGGSIPFPGAILKRILDVILSCAALLLLWPLLLVIALAVKLESSGPAIYASLRAGKKGQKFVCYKFRTMIDKADELKSSLRRFNDRKDPFFKIADDPRVTRLGRFLRKYSLDELPQFWNVLKGDMSLVGPRPHPLDDVERYSPWHHGRLDVRPGLTGLWQVTARADSSFETCMVLDLGYIRSWSLLLDCRILMRTIPAVLAGEGQ